MGSIRSYCIRTSDQIFIYRYILYPSLIQSNFSKSSSATKTEGNVTSIVNIVIYSKLESTDSKEVIFVRVQLLLRGAIWSMKTSILKSEGYFIQSPYFSNTKMQAFFLILFLLLKDFGRSHISHLNPLQLF